MLKINKEFKLPKDFKEKYNLNLLAQAFYVFEDRSHVGLRKTQTRSEVNRTTKKLYKQKGTGGARHGSRRAPIFVGGGVALGPRPIRRIKNLPENFKVVAKKMAFSAKINEKVLEVVDGISGIKKTKEASSFIKGLGAKRVTFLLSDKNKTIGKFLGNIKNVKVLPYKDANAYQILLGGTILLDQDIFEIKKAKTEK